MALTLAKQDQKWTDSIAIAAGAAGDQLYIPEFVKDLVIIVEVGAGATVSVFYTTNDPELIAASPGTGPWIAWDAGSITVDTGASVESGISALRIVSVGGTCEVFVSGNRR